MNGIHVFILVGLFLPSNSVRYNKTYGNLEFISPGTPASLSSARSWCKEHESTLAEIPSEHIWNLTVLFLGEFMSYSRDEYNYEFERRRKYDFGWNHRHRYENVILNANGMELPAWQWISGETFAEGVAYPLRNDEEMYARLTSSSKGTISINGSFPKCRKECRFDYVCEHVHDSKCEIQSFNSIPLDGSCYVFHHNKNVNWFEAYYECEKNNGRLATFRNIQEKEGRIAEQLKEGREYWLGLYRYEWRWADSRELLSFTDIDIHYSQLYPNDSTCLFVSFDPSYRQTHAYLIQRVCIRGNDRGSFKFVCIQNVTHCASNPCENGGTCIASITNYNCRCAPGFLGSHCQKNTNDCVNNSCQIWEKGADSINHYTCRCAAGFPSSLNETNTNKCGSTPCHSGATFSDHFNNYTCLCAHVVYLVKPENTTESHCHICANTKIEPPASGMMMKIMTTIVVVQAVVIIIISAILVVVCIRKKNKTRKSNDAELATRYETRNTSVLDNHVYSDIIRGSDEQDNIGADGRQPAGQESLIYEQVVQVTKQWSLGVFVYAMTKMECAWDIFLQTHLYLRMFHYNYCYYYFHLCKNLSKSQDYFLSQWIK